MDELGPCPNCRKREGEIITRQAKFPFYAKCNACGWTTNPAKLRAVAVKLWNEATRRSS